MLKFALLGAAMAMTAPALAQTALPADPAAGASVQTAPIPETSAQALHAAIAPADPVASQAASADQVARVVDSRFASYDRDADGKLDEAEFGAWMVALKTLTDPATDADSPATKSWNRAAFAQADTDRSKSLSKAELTGFLVPEDAS